MKIAVAESNGLVSQHFGYSEHFVVVDIEGKQIISQSMVENPGHRPGFLPEFLAERGVTTIIVGGMGSGAADLFESHHIKTITGVVGTVDSAIQKWLANNLISSDSICHEHQHH